MWEEHCHSFHSPFNVDQHTTHIEFTLAKALQEEGYTTGHAGKWHMAIQHNAYPDAKDQGFGWSRSSRGARSSMKPDRISDFATRRKNDPYRLDANGFPYHQNSEDALTFLNENRDKPFFLYYAPHIPHYPHVPAKQFQGRSKVGLYGDFINELDWAVGQIVSAKSAARLYGRSNAGWGKKSSGRIAKGFTPGASPPSSK